MIMNDSDNKNNSPHNYYKINIIKPQEKEETINLKLNNQNLLTFLGSPKRKKSKIHEKMENSFCIKKYKNEYGAHGEKILKEFHKSHKSQTIKNSIIDKTALLRENKSISVMTEKNDIEDDNIIEKSITKSEKKNSINFNININNNNTNEILNIIKFINNLYTDDNHFQKKKPIKTLSIKYLPKINKNSINNSPKKKVSVQFRLESHRKKTIKSSNEIQPHNIYIKDQKIDFDNCLNLDQKYKKEKSIGFFEIERDTKFNNKNCSSKSLKSYQSIFNKSIKSKKKRSKSKFNPDKKSNINKEKKRQEFEVFKNTLQSNETDKQNNKSTKTKKETPTKKSNDKEEKKEAPKINNDDNNKKKRKYNFCNLFCCLNS